MPNLAPDRKPILTVATLLLPAAALLYLFPPTDASLYPRCPFHSFTGLLCPGCGATRALAALLHGRLAEALHDNALIIALLPLAALYLGLAFRRSQWPRIPVAVTSVLLAAAFLFTLYRNLA